MRYNVQNTAAAAIKTTAIAAITVGCFALQAQAEQATTEPGVYATDQGGGDRINFAGKTRMLSQRIAGAACIEAHSDDKAEMAATLDAAIVKYDKIINALRDGNSEMHIVGAEKKRKILVRLDAQSELWKPFYAAAEIIKSGKDSEESLKFIAENNMALLGLAKDMVVEVKTKYANPVDITESEALLIDFAGRQRMLTQKIAKEACGVVSDHTLFGNLDDMNKTIAMYKTTLNALYDGMPAVGLMPPPTDEIKANLEQAMKLWKETSEVLSTISGKDSMDASQLVDLFKMLHENLSIMNKITGQYSVYAETH